MTKRSKNDILMSHLEKIGDIMEREMMPLYLLVYEKRPGDSMPVNISFFDDNKYDYNHIENIDTFTKKYTEDELYNIVLNSNTIGSDYLSGNIYIMENNKKRLKVIFKDTLNDFDLILFLKNNINDKQVLNVLYNKYTSLLGGIDNELKNGLKDILKVEVINSKEDEKELTKIKLTHILYYINNLPYVKRRELELYLSQYNDEKSKDINPKVKELLKVS